MSINVYDLPPATADERKRERAVAASGALRASDDVALVSIANDARRLFGTAMAAITIVSGDWQYVIAAAGIPAGPYSRRTSFCGHVIAEPDRVMCVPDAQDDERFAGNPSVAGTGLVRFYTGAPIVNADGFALGALCIFDPKPRMCLSKKEEREMQRLASTVMSRLGAMQNG